MKNKSLLIWVLVLVLLIGGAYALYTSLGDRIDMQQIAPETPTAAPDSTQPPKHMAPDFTVQDADGNPVRLSDFRGKPVVLNFWSSRCGPCKREMPDFDKQYKVLGDKVHFVMVNVTDGYWDTLESAQKFVAENGYSFPVYFDTEVSAAMAYGVTALPSTYFIDAEGALVARANGMITEKMLQQGLDMILPQS